MAYRDQSWSKRKQTLGYQAEGVFDRWCDRRGVLLHRLGFQGSDFEYYAYLPQELRYLPDVVGEDTDGYIRRKYHPNLRRHFLCEVKGCGRDGVIKIKPAHLDVWARYEDFYKRDVLLFAYDSHRQKCSISLNANQLNSMRDDFEIKTFREGNKYYAVPRDVFIWEDCEWAATS